MSSKWNRVKVTILTIHPDFVKSYLDFGPLKYAMQHGSLTVQVLDLRDFSTDKHRSIDDRVYGGGEGMLLSPLPIARALESIRPFNRVIYTMPGAKKWNRSCIEEYLDSLRVQVSSQDWTEDSPEIHWVFLCGRFSGIDQRILDRYGTDFFSIGDFVVSGGELPVLLILDSIARFLPGAVGNEQSVLQDSFENFFDGEIEYPQYTRPAVFEGLEVPPVLLSGDRKKILDWKQGQLRKNFD